MQLLVVIVIGPVHQTNHPCRVPCPIGFGELYHWRCFYDGEVISLMYNMLFSRHLHINKYRALKVDDITITPRNLSNISLLRGQHSIFLFHNSFTFFFRRYARKFKPITYSPFIYFGGFTSRVLAPNARSYTIVIYSRSSTVCRISSYAVKYHD